MIRIKCFAALRERLGVGETETAFAPGMTVRDVWQAVTSEAPPDNLLCARNQEYSELDAAVQDGDEVAFFPPVTGG